MSDEKQGQTTRTWWACDRCTRGGLIPHEPHADAWEIFDALYHAHFYRSPECRFDLGSIRVTEVPVHEGPTR